MQDVSLRASALGESAAGTVMNFTLARPGDYSKPPCLVTLLSRVTKAIATQEDSALCLAYKL